ncbi:MAG: hypothetical protein KAS63_09565 [Candidatus Heimdallarchaeota archaeon]|nr:hypothetical protein [Candidatus Heimdallarchaeota archaeon]MCK4955597.1 hypothetical protein [Candidatus Heimdallarchaeota archaeon]
MFAPFDRRHKEAFQSIAVNSIIKKIKVNKGNTLKIFTKECIDYALNQKVDENFKDLALDSSICTRDFQSVLQFTESFSRTEHFIYRAYAYSRLNMTNKIVSLKLQFQQKYADSLDLPRNSFITGSMEFLLLYGEQNYTMALTTIEEIEQLLALHPNELENKLFTQLILTLGCQAYLQISNFDKVEALARKILQSAVKMEDPYFQSVALNLITTVLINKGEFRKAQKMMSAAILPADETGLAADRASLLNNSAKLELARGDYERSIKLLEQIYELVSGNPRAQAISAINITELNILLNRTKSAEDMLETSLLLDKKHNLQLIEPYLLSAWISIVKNDLDKAESFLQISQERIDTTGEIRKQPNILYFNGLLNLRKNQTDSAIDFLEQANKRAAELQNIELLIKTQLQLANIFLERFNQTKELADYSSILSYLNNLAYISEEQFIPRLMCDLHLLKGMLLAQGGKKEKAIEDIIKAHDLASKFNYKQMQKEANRLLKQVEKEKRKEFDEIQDLKVKGFADANRMTEVLQKYEGFKFIKSPKQVESILHGVAIVEADTAVIKYRYITEHEEDNAASLVPTVVAAVNMYSKSVLEEEVLLNEVKEEGKELLIGSINEYLIVAIAEKITFELKLQFEKFVDILTTKLPDLTPNLEKDEHQKSLNKLVEDYFFKPEPQDYRETETIPAIEKQEIETQLEKVETVDIDEEIEVIEEKATEEKIKTDIDDDILELEKAVNELEESIQFADLEGIETEGEMKEIEEEPEEESEMKLEEELKEETVDELQEELEEESLEQLVDELEEDLEEELEEETLEQLIEELDEELEEEPEEEFVEKSTEVPDEVIEEKEEIEDKEELPDELLDESEEELDEVIEEESEQIQMEELDTEEDEAEEAEEVESADAETEDEAEEKMEKQEKESVENTEEESDDESENELEEID